MKNKALLFCVFSFTFLPLIVDGMIGKKRKIDEVSGGVEESQVKRAKKETYSVNLMWINRDKNLDQKYIHPSKTKEDLEQAFLRPILGWAAKNNESTVNVWYDGVFISEKAVTDTDKLMKKYAKKHSEKTEYKIRTIKFRDIRALAKVRQHPAVFSDEINVYFRVDLTRPIIALHLLSGPNPEVDYFVYADLDMKPLSRDKLFDESTQETLDRFGIVMAMNDPDEDFENGFQIIGNKNKKLLEAMELVVVDVNIQRAHNTYDPIYDPCINFPAASVFYSYEDMFKYFYALQGWGTLAVKFKNETGNIVTKLYDKEDGIVPFGLKDFLTYQRVFTIKNDLIRKKKNSECLEFPKKKVKLPKSEGTYDTEPLRVTDANWECE